MQRKVSRVCECRSELLVHSNVACGVLLKFLHSRLEAITLRLQPSPSIVLTSLLGLIIIALVWLGLRQVSDVKMLNAIEPHDEEKLQLLPCSSFDFHCQQLRKPKPFCQCF